VTKSSIHYPDQSSSPSNNNNVNSAISPSKTPPTTTTTKTIQTRLDTQAMKAAYATGVAIAKMHNANIIHGDLTTSNIMVRNPPPRMIDEETTTKEEQHDDSSWIPDIVLIDFGLSSTHGGGGHGSSSKNKNRNKTQTKTPAVIIPVEKN